MAYNAGDLVARAQKRIRDTGYSSTDMLGHLSDELYDIYNEYPNLFPVQTSTNYTLTVNDEDITSGSGLPDTFSQGVNVEITTSGYECDLPVVDFRWIKENYPDANDTTAHPANTPQYVYWLDGTINVFPVPNLAYTVKVTHYSEPDEVTSEDAVPDLPKRYREMLVLGMAYRALQIKDNYDQAAILQNIRDKQLLQFVVKTAQPFMAGPKIMRINRRALGKSHF